MWFFFGLIVILPVAFGCGAAPKNTPIVVGGFALQPVKALVEFTSIRAPIAAQVLLSDVSYPIWHELEVSLREVELGELPISVSPERGADFCFKRYSVSTVVFRSRSSSGSVTVERLDPGRSIAGRYDVSMDHRAACRH